MKSAKSAPSRVAMSSHPTRGAWIEIVLAAPLTR